MVFDSRDNDLRALKVIGILLSLLTTTPVYAQGVAEGFQERTFTAESGARLPYRLFVPDISISAERFPIVVYLHGAAGAGTDNRMQITGGNARGARLWAEPLIQARHPAFVVAPQIPEGGTWSSPGSDLSLYAGLVVELVASLAREFSIDMDRVYLVGQSLGGSGVWDLIAKRPDFFAAAMPICGGGSPSRIVAADHIAVWAFHGAQDRIVPVIRSREMVGALRAVGSSIRYTEYPESGHDVWTKAFSEPLLPDWIFAQKRAQPAERAGQAGTQCTAVADAVTGRLIKQDGACDQRITPASTFKIALALMGYDSGYLTDEHLPALPFHESYPAWLDSWRATTDPARWIKNSVVWYSWQITEWLGEERFKRYVSAFQYGNGDVSGNPGKSDGLTQAWLTSSLKISPLEQLDFIGKLVRRQLPVTARAYDMTNRITAIEVLSNGWEVHGKTGTGFHISEDGSVDRARQVGWFVGWATKGGQTLVFARCTEDEARPAPNLLGPRIREAFMKELPSLLDSL